MLIQWNKIHIQWVFKTHFILQLMEVCSNQGFLTCITPNFFPYFFMELLCKCLWEQQGVAYFNTKHIMGLMVHCQWPWLHTQLSSFTEVFTYVHVAQWYSTYVFIRNCVQHVCVHMWVWLADLSTRTVWLCDTRNSVCSHDLKASSCFHMESQILSYFIMCQVPALSSYYGYGLASICARH